LAKLFFISTGCTTEISVDLASPSDDARETFGAQHDKTCNEQKHNLAA
jgi:hypothetical protein